MPLRLSKQIRLRLRLRLEQEVEMSVETEGTGTSFTALQRKEMADAMAPGRWRTPEEIADAVVFLCSDAARGVHGAILNVNGGSYMP
jgi:NAD(P)-dependent dehydrogenase (short-subunit alcohol dehydrogenase family)